MAVDGLRRSLQKPRFLVFLAFLFPGLGLLRVSGLGDFSLGLRASKDFVAGGMIRAEQGVVNMNRGFRAT